MTPHLQPGTQLDVVWRARLEDHMGTFTAEPLRSRASILGDRLGLMGLNAVCAMLHVTLPEREVHPLLWRQTVGLLDALEARADWAPIYLRWELLLLEELGFGLDLGSCAVTGSRDDLIYVSPKSGRAVSRAGAGDWAQRLLPLPQVLLGQGPAQGVELQQGLALTGFFLNKGLEPVLHGRPMPEARARLLEALARVAD